MNSTTRKEKNNRTCNVEKLAYGQWSLNLHEHLKTKTHTDKYVMECELDAPGLICYVIDKYESTRPGKGPETYHVQIAAEVEDSTCDCLGHQNHGHCKHVESIHALIADDRMPAILPAEFVPLSSSDLDVLESHETAWMNGPELD